MRVSRFLAAIPLSTLTLLLFNGETLALNQIKTQPSVPNFKTRLQQVYTYNNRPLSKILTVQDAKGIGKIPSVKDSHSKGLIAMGGVSDGGGNAVGTTLFDFYENEGSLAISVDQLLVLEPEMTAIINKLNKQVPQVEIGSDAALAFGNQIRDALSKKKLILEPKEIASAACLNSSVIQSQTQKVVACQSDDEIRFNLSWLESTDAKNRVGLFTHEMILAWARSLDVPIAKDILEKNVRILNRVIFNNQSSEEDLANAISNLFGVRTYSPKRLVLSQRILSLQKNLRKEFCNNAKFDIRTPVQDILSQRFFYGHELSASFLGAVEISDSLANEGSVAYSRYEQYCSDFRIRYGDINKSNSQNLPPVIKNLIETTYLNKLIKITGLLQTKVISEKDFSFLQQGVLEKLEMDISLNFKERNQEQILADGITYLRTLLQQKGFDLVDTGY